MYNTVSPKAYMLKACPLLGVRGWGGRWCIAPPNSLIYKKSPANCCLRDKRV